MEHTATDNFTFQYRGCDRVHGGYEFEHMCVKVRANGKFFFWLIVTRYYSRFDLDRTWVDFEDIRDKWIRQTQENCWKRVVDIWNLDLRRSPRGSHSSNSSTYLVELIFIKSLNQRVMDQPSYINYSKSHPFSIEGFFLIQLTWVS